MRRLALLALLALAACARSDFEKICNSEQLSGADAIRDPAQRHLAAARWLEGRVHSSEAKAVLASFATFDHMGQKGTNLVDAARRAGYDGPCPFADDWVGDLSSESARPKKP